MRSDWARPLKVLFEYEQRDSTWVSGVDIERVHPRHFVPSMTKFSQPQMLVHDIQTAGPLTRRCANPPGR